MARDVASRLRLKQIRIPVYRARIFCGQGRGFSLEIETYDAEPAASSLDAVARDVASRLRLKRLLRQCSQRLDRRGQGRGFSLEIETCLLDRICIDHLTWPGTWLLA